MKTRNAIWRIAPSALALAALMSTTGLSAQAEGNSDVQDELVLLENARVTTYLNGGAGTDNQAYIQHVAKDWPLRMSFAMDNGKEFVANVQLSITDYRGAPVLVLNDAGPMTYARIPDGTYRISATLNGVTESRAVTLNSAQGRDVAFHWKGTPQYEPWDHVEIGG